MGDNQENNPAETREAEGMKLVRQLKRAKRAYKLISKLSHSSDMRYELLDWITYAEESILFRGKKNGGW